MKSGSYRTAAWMAIICAAILFVLMAAYDIRLPGMNYDEVIQVTPAMRCVQGSFSLPVVQHGCAVGFGRHRLLSMTMGYIGAVKSLIFVPVVALFGSGPVPIRLTTIAIGAIAIIFTGFFARRVLGIAGAVIFAVLLALDPSYPFFCRTDYGPTACMMALKGFILWQLAVWWQTQRDRAIYLASLAAGVGVYDKANFLWILGAILIAAGCLRRREIYQRLTPRVVGICTVMFAIGCAPLIYFNLHWPLPTLHTLKSQNEVAYINDTGSIGHRVVDRIQVLEKLLAGESIPYFHQMNAPLTSALPWLVCIAVIVTIAAWLMLRGNWAREMFLLLAMVLIILFAAFTPGGRGPHHLILAYPFPHLLIAAVAARASCKLFALPKSFFPRLIGLGLLTFMIGLAPVAGMLRWRQITNQLAVTGGEGNYSDAIYPLANWLKINGKDRPVVVLDWGIALPLCCLTDGKISISEHWEQGNDHPDLNGFLDNPKTLFCFHAPAETRFPDAVEALQNDARNRHLRLDILATFSERRGNPVLVVASTRPAD